MRQVGRYDIDDPGKIQGRDEVHSDERSVAAIRLRYCLDALDGTSGRVLLLGCGAGRYARALHRGRPDLSVVGGDLSIAALREARRTDPAGDYLSLDAGCLPFPDSSFGAVVFFDLLEHVPGHFRMLGEIARVLKPDGVLHFYVPLEDQPGSIYRVLGSSGRFPIRTWKQDHVGHINFFRSEDVLHDVWHAGLKVVDTRYGFHPFGQVHDLVDYWQRERQSGGPGILPPALVQSIARGIFLFTWRLSYIEDRLYDGRTLASGLHLTARKG